MLTPRKLACGAGVRFAVCLSASLVIAPIANADMPRATTLPLPSRDAPPPLAWNWTSMTEAARDGQLMPAGMGPGIFGSVAIPFGPLPAMPRWKRVLAERSDRILTQPCSDDDRVCETPVVKRLVQTLQNAPQSRVSLLKAVNSAVNDVLAYRRDQDLHGTLDHWATLSETALAGGGDCEDFAIVKMWALHAAGIPMNAMRLVVVRDTDRERYHAILAVQIRGETFILDSASSRIWRDSELQHYIPLYSVGQDRAWVHGFPSERDRVASGGLRSVYPGEPAAGGSS